MILHNFRIAGCAISRKTAIVLLKNGASIKLTTKWACGILKSVEW